MPLPIVPDLSPTLQSPMTASYPATSKQAAGVVDGITTQVTSISFSDKIMVTVTQAGRLAQWIHVPLDSASPTYADQHLPAPTDDNDLLPMSHLTPKTLLGVSTPERETIGQLYATQIASAIALKNPQENRTIIIGLGLSKTEANRETFLDTVDLVLRCL
ncbi:hypothetical protein MMC12_005568 [Toensbergia leucococca]|nr:hypothetical protein [Toensbergia leucococca]